MNLQLQGKTALVTGSSSGIGAGIAKVLAAEGCSVAIHGRDLRRAKEVAEEIRNAGGQAITVIGELANNEDADEIARSALEQLGCVDILVNNAGHGNPRGNIEWLEVTEEDFVHLYQGNFLSGVRMIRRLLPQMKQRRWGRVIMISSAGALQPIATIPDYQAAKIAQINLAVSLARAVAGTGVTSNCVIPGPIMTPLQQGFLRDLAKQYGWGTDDQIIEKRAVKEFFCLGTERIGTPEDIGRMVAFLASPLNAFITGASYRVDGGYVKSI